MIALPRPLGDEEGHRYRRIPINAANRRLASRWTFATRRCGCVNGDQYGYYFAGPEQGDRLQKRGHRRPDRS